MPVTSGLTACQQQSFLWAVWGQHHPRAGGNGLLLVLEALYGAVCDRDASSASVPYALSPKGSGPECLNVPYIYERENPPLNTVH